MDSPADSLFIFADQYGRSAPWLQLNHKSGGALTCAQVEEIAQRFELDQGAMDSLSRQLAFLLDPSVHILTIHMSSKIATERAAREINKALSETTTAKCKLEQAVIRLQRLNTGSALNADGALRLEQLKRVMTQTQHVTAEALKELQLLAAIPDIALVIENTRKGPVLDLRRKSVMFALFRHWEADGRKLTYTTDAVLQKRSGPLIDFVNAMVSCITDPPTALPGDTIVSDLRALLARRKASSSASENQGLGD